eukprot:g283.t1
MNKAASSFPTFLDPEDLKQYVQSAVKLTVQAALPELQTGLQEAAKVQDELVMKLLRQMDKNTTVVSRTIAQQGRLFICMGIAGIVINDRDWSRWEKLGYLVSGVGGFLLFSKALEIC